VTNETCGRPFAEDLLTGYLDGVLTQADDQRVRLHLEECAACRRLTNEMHKTREATMTTRFQLPADDQWDERPRGLVSRMSLGLGWVLLLSWAVGILGLLVGHLWSDAVPLTEKLLLFGGLSGAALLFVSVLIDRLKTMRNDPYRRVER
jgi:predicted anti-sigma-YlaC factor YlaD